MAKSRAKSFPRVFWKGKHWDDLVIGSFGQLQAVMQEGFKQWNIPRQEAKALPRLVAFGDLGCHNDRILGAVSLQRQIDVNHGTPTLWLLARSRPQQMNLWFALSDNGLRMQLGAAFPIDLVGRLVHALLLMPFMIMDLCVPTNGNVAATDATVHGQDVCRTVGFAAAGELDAKSREAQHTQLWDRCVGLVVMLRSFTSWRSTFDELDIQPATVALVGRSPTSNTKIHATKSVVIVFVSPSSLTSHWMKQVLDYTPNVTQWCLSRRNLEPAETNEFHPRNFILQHTSSVAVSFLVAAPVDVARKDVKTQLQHLKTWPNLVCPVAQCDLSASMLVWLSWYVIVYDQAGKPELFPSFTVMSISGAHYRQFRPEWAFAGGAGTKQPNFPMGSLPASSGLTSDATRDVQGSELYPFGFIGLHEVFTQQLFALLVIMQKERNEAPKMLSWSAWDGSSLLSNTTGVADGNGRQSSPTVGTMPITTIHHNCKHISPVCVHIRGCSTPCARFMTLTLKLLGVFLPRTGLQCYVSAVLSLSASCLASQFPTSLCWSTHARLSTLLTAPAERTKALVINPQGSLEAISA